MLQDQCISVTDLRTKTKECLEDLNNQPKYIFMNNKPIAVIVDIGEYEKHFMKPELIELSKDETSDGLLKKAAVARRLKKADLINI